jgi:8-oxo-dGTP diphosphatase
LPEFYNGFAFSLRSSGEELTLTKRVTAALIRRGDEILCCQRTEHQSLPLKWEFPGGKIEAGETALQALQRELEEELGIKAEIGQEVAQVFHTYDNGSSVNLCFHVVDSYQHEIENRIFRDVRWVKRRDLPELDFLDADKDLVRRLAAGDLL